MRLTISYPVPVSSLKNAWDEVFANTQLKMLIAGRHISAMEKLLESDAPLFGRMAGKVLVWPFSFVEVAPYLRHYELEKRLVVFAFGGGIPDCLRRWDDRANEPPACERRLALFTRRSATATVRSAAKAAVAQVITFAELVRDLERLPEHPDA